MNFDVEKIKKISMIKVKLDQPLLGVDGKQIGTETIGRQFAYTLTNALGEKGSSAKYLNWAMKLYDNKTIEIDDADFNQLIDFVDANKEGMKVLLHAQIENQLRKIKDNVGKSSVK